MAVIINGDYGMTTPTGVFTDSSGNVGIGCTPNASYKLDIQNPDTTSGADTYIRLKSNSVSGDGDAQIYLDSSDTGESAIVFQSDGVVTSYLQVINGDDYVQLSNEVTGADLYLMSGVTALNDAYALRVARDSGEAVISGITGTITASALETTITGLSTTTGLYNGMFLTRTAGTGAFGVSTTIKYIDAGTSTITIESSAAMTAGSITFTATPNPTTIHIYSLSGGTWAVDQDFARLAFGNADASGAGDGGIKASINAYVYDVDGTGAGLDFYVSSNGTTLTKALRMTQTGGVEISRTAVTTPASTDGNVFSGTYTPTLTNTTNIAASTPYVCQYMRVGNVVTVSGRLNIDPTAATTASELGISLPIASDITASTECAGTGAIQTSTTEVSSGGILGDTTNNRAQFRFVAGGTAARDYGFTFTYLVG